MAESPRGFDDKQVKQLLNWINENRIIESQGHSHLSQQDVRAHLIRIFGFGNFDIRIHKVEMIFEEPHIDKSGEEVAGKFDVCYKAQVQLVIRDRWGNEMCNYEEVATSTAQNQKRGEAHDLAMKSAVSYAIKRCAINLGDQFGLSLYNNGQRAGLVKGTLVVPWVVEENAEKKDIQEDVEPQLSLGLFEDSAIETEDSGAVIGSGKPALDRSKPEATVYSEETVENAGNAIDMLAGFTTAAEVEKFYNDNPALHDVPYKKTTLTRATKKRLEEIANGS